MGVSLFANDAVSSLAVALAPTDTEISLVTGGGGVFPSPTGGDYFAAALYSATQKEYIKVTARTADSLTVLRGQENTSPLEWSAGDKIELRLTKATMDALAQSVTMTQAIADAVAAALAGAAVVGEIKAHTGSAAPAGFLLCQGQAVSRTTYAALFAVVGTTYGVGDGSTTFNIPDGRDRVLIGAGSTYALGSTGGAASVTPTLTVAVAGHALSIAELPPHPHPASDSGHVHADAGHTHGVNASGTGASISDPGHYHLMYGGQNYYANTGQPFGLGGGGSFTGFGPQFGKVDISGTGITFNDAAHAHSLTAAAANIQASSANITVGNTGGGATHTHTATATSNAVATVPPFLATNYIIKT